MAVQPALASISHPTSSTNIDSLEGQVTLGASLLMDQFGISATTATMIYDGASLAGEIAAVRFAMKGALTSIKQTDEFAFVDDFAPN